MYLVDNSIMDYLIEHYPSETMIYASLVPSMKVIRIDSKVPTITVPKSEKLRTIVEGILDLPHDTIDKFEEFEYNAQGTHRASFEDGVLCIYYQYTKIKKDTYCEK